MLDKVTPTFQVEYHAKVAKWDYARYLMDCHITKKICDAAYMERKILQETRTLEGPDEWC